MASGHKARLSSEDILENVADTSSIHVLKITLIGPGSTIVLGPEVLWLEQGARSRCIAKRQRRRTWEIVFEAKAEREG